MNHAVATTAIARTSHGSAVAATRRVGAVQTLGGRRSGGTRDPLATCDSAGGTREVTAKPNKVDSPTGENTEWKHLTRQLPMSAQTFCGQCGQGFTGLWQGMWSAAAAAAVGVAMARAVEVVIGNATSAPSMATMPRTANQRWKPRFLTPIDCHSGSSPARHDEVRCPGRVPHGVSRVKNEHCCS
jgi:hypothetical protein